MQVALVVVGSELDVATQIDLVVTVGTEPIVSAAARLLAVPSWGSELDGALAGMRQFGVGGEFRPPVIQSVDFEVVL